MSKISDIGLVITGKTPSTQKMENWGNDVPFYTPDDIAEGFVLNDSIRHISNAGFDAIKKNTVDGLSVLTGCIGSDMGNVAVVNKKSAFNQQINAITKFKENVNPYYVYYFLSTRKEYLRQLAGSTATPILPKSDFEKIDIPLPNKEKQDTIVFVLKTLDTRIKTNKIISSTLESLAKTIYDYWFVQFDFPDENGKPYKSSGGKMVWNEELKREIPEGWEVKPLEDILELLKDGTHNPPKRVASGIPLLTGTMFGSNFLNYSQATFITEKDYQNIHASYAPQECDIVLTKIGTLGNVNYLRKCDIPIAIHCNSALLRFPVTMAGLFSYMYCKSEEFQKRLRSAKGQSVQEFCSLDSIGSISMLVPNKREILLYQSHMKAVLTQMESISLENRQLEALRDFLLPMLMNGQVIVKESS